MKLRKEFKGKNVELGLSTAKFSVLKIYLIPLCTVQLVYCFSCLKKQFMMLISISSLQSILIVYLATTSWCDCLSTS